MNSSPLIAQLIDAFRCLPGVGPKSAQRMTLFLLEKNRPGGIKLSESLSAALTSVGNCKECRNLTEDEICSICSSNSRDKKLCCVVESPTGNSRGQLGWQLARFGLTRRWVWVHLGSGPI